MGHGGFIDIAIHQHSPKNRTDLRPIQAMPARYRELFLMECPGSFLSFAEAQEARRRKSVGGFHGKNHGKNHLRMEVFMGKSSKPMGKMPLPCLTIRLNQRNSKMVLKISQFWLDHSHPLCFLDMVEAFLLQIWGHVPLGSHEKSSLMGSAHNQRILCSPLTSFMICHGFQLT